MQEGFMYYKIPYAKVTEFLRLRDGLLSNTTNSDIQNLIRLLEPVEDVDVLINLVLETHSSVYDIVEHLKTLRGYYYTDNEALFKKYEAKEKVSKSELSIYPYYYEVHSLRDLIYPAVLSLMQFLDEADKYEIKDLIKLVFQNLLKTRDSNVPAKYQTQFTTYRLGVITGLILIRRGFTLNKELRGASFPKKIPKPKEIDLAISKIIKKI